MPIPVYWYTSSTTVPQIEKLRNILLSRENLLTFKRTTRLPLDPHVLVSPQTMPPLESHAANYTRGYHN